MSNPLLQRMLNVLESIEMNTRKSAPAPAETLRYGHKLSCNQAWPEMQKGHIQAQKALGFGDKPYCSCGMSENLETQDEALHGEKQKPRRIYLGCPYSHPDPAVKEARFKAVNKVAAELMKRGHLVFSPISHTHPIALAGGLPGDFAFWEAYDKTFIEWCDEVWILMIDGWEKSIGVAGEIIIAKEMNKPVKYLSASLPIVELS